MVRNLRTRIPEAVLSPPELLRQWMLNRRSAIVKHRTAFVFGEWSVAQEYKASALHGFVLP